MAAVLVAAEEHEVVSAAVQLHAGLEELELEYLYLDFDQRMLAKGAGMSKFETPEADREFVDQILILLDAEAGCEAQKVELLARLEVEVNALEERVQMIVKK